MTRKDRVKQVISHKECPYCPHNIELTSGALDSFCAYAGIDKKDFAGYAGNHLEKCSFNGGEVIKEGYFKDEFNVVWNRTGIDKDIGVVETYLLEDTANLASLPFPPVDREAIAAKCKAFIAKGTDTFKLAKVGMTLFERAWSLRGMENILMDMYDEEDFVAELLKKIADYDLEIINETLHYDFDGYYFGDDYGQQKGMIMGPPLWRKFIKPELARVFAPIKKKGIPVFLHSCGDNEAIFNDLIEIGLDVYQTVQPEIYDLAKIKKEYGNRLSFFGAISTQKTLAFVKPAELKEIITQTIQTLNVNGGYICAPTHQVQADVPNENIKMMIETFTGQSA
jgi:uroporphyrinogen decarboxylase